MAETSPAMTPEKVVQPSRSAVLTFTLRIANLCGSYQTAELAAIGRTCKWPNYGCKR
jgi:hypothetical protein